MGFRRLRDIEVIGDTVCGEKDGVLRLLYENFDGFPLSSKNNRHGKARKLNMLKKRLGLDQIGGSEVQGDWGLMHRKNPIEKILDDTPRMQAATSYNTHE